MTSHETVTETQRTVTPNCCDDNGLGAALGSVLAMPMTRPARVGTRHRQSASNVGHGWRASTVLASCLQIVRLRCGHMRTHSERNANSPLGTGMEASNGR